MTTARLLLLAAALVAGACASDPATVTDGRSSGGDGSPDDSSIGFRDHMPRDQAQQIDLPASDGLDNDGSGSDARDDAPAPRCSGTTCAVKDGKGQCQGGVCVVVSCDAGFDNCDKDDKNGCEAKLDSIETCGTCTNKCEFQNANAACASGTCFLATCKTGFGDCDGLRKTGCETPVTTLTNCGACRKPCTIKNGSGDCSSGTCQIGKCTPPFEDCNKAANDGCEADAAWYPDLDKDGFGDTSNKVVQCAMPPGSFNWTHEGTDCYDKNANAKPGQTSYFPAHRGDNSYDYDCDNKATQRWTVRGRCIGCNLSAAGWQTTAPGCGAAGNWLYTCRKIFSSCLPRYQPRTQECR